MGNCGSSAKVENPRKVINPVPIKKEDDDIEEIKSPGKYCKPSVEFYSMNDDFGGRKDWIKKEMSRVSSRSHSTFNLQKDIIESLKNEERARRFEHTSTEFREKNDATSYKITEEQHFAIYMFVEETNRIIYEEIFKLYTHLIRNIQQEHEDLSLVVEGLRCYNRDVENCIEDLQAHPIDNEKYFYLTIEKNSQLVRVVISEYNTFRAHLKNYKGFREVVLSHIKQYNLSQQDTGISEETPEFQNLKDKSKTRQPDTYNQFITDFNKLKEDQIALNEMAEALKRDNSSKNHFLERIRISKQKHKELESQIDTTVSNIERSTDEHLVSSDEYIIQLKKLGTEVKRQAEGLVNLEAFALGEKEYNSKVSEKGSAMLKKFDSSTRMFMDGKPASSAKIEVRKGDNIDIELEVLNENEESPNLADKLRGLSLGEPSPTKPKHLSKHRNYL